MKKEVSKKSFGLVYKLIFAISDTSVKFILQLCRTWCHMIDIWYHLDKKFTKDLSYNFTSENVVQCQARGVGGTQSGPTQQGQYLYDVMFAIQIVG